MWLLEAEVRRGGGPSAAKSAARTAPKAGSDRQPRYWMSIWRTGRSSLATNSRWRTSTLLRRSPRSTDPSRLSLSFRISWLGSSTRWKLRLRGRTPGATPIIEPRRSSAPSVWPFSRHSRPSELRPGRGSPGSCLAPIGCFRLSGYSHGVQTAPESERPHWTHLQRRLWTCSNPYRRRRDE